MIYLFVLVAILIGALMPVQAGLNAQLTQSLKHPFLGAFVSLTTGAIVVGGMSLFHGDIGNLKRLPEIPPHLFVGGLFGALFVGSSLFFIPRMGATAMIASFITGQLICSVMIDHFGWLGLPSQPVQLHRVLGVFLLFVGLFLVIRKSA